MNKHLCVLALSTTLIAGCGHGRFDKEFPWLSVERGFDPAVVRAPTKCLVNVFIVDDKIVIDQEPVYAKGCDDAGKRKIVWRLPDPVYGQPVYSFGSIDFRGPSRPAGLDCGLQGSSGQVYRCKFDRGNGESYKYAIVVKRDGQDWKSLDPMMIND